MSFPDRSVPSPFRRVDLDLAPVEVAARMRASGGLVFFDSASGGSPALSIVAAAPSRIIRGSTTADWDALSAAVTAPGAPLSSGPDFPSQFAAGFVEYNGEFVFGLYENLLVFDHSSATWMASGVFELPAQEPAPARGAAPQFSTPISREAFCRRVRRAQEYIAAGDIYQVNLAHHFTADTDADAFSFYRALRRFSPAPFAAYLDLDGRHVLSSSPESFLRMKGTHVRTRPIKGTRPRRADALLDEQSAGDLVASAKENAELVMITDLERNDLGQVCQFGTVRVVQLRELERHEHVFHLSSTIEGELRSDVTHVETLRRCFPGGSITGAPKRRAMEIIAELEPEPRGLYTGAIGWFGLDGASQFNIGIRTVTMEGGRARFGVGAGIVADSIPEQEYQETLDKAAGILLAAARM